MPKLAQSFKQRTNLITQN